MKAIRGNLLPDARRHEQAGEPEAAAELYQQILKNDPGNKDAVDRLLVIYRRLKDYRKELGVINGALEAISRKGKTAQQAWVSAHPEVAKLGKAMLKSMGGEQATMYGTDPRVEQLEKRKALVERRLGGGKGKTATKPVKKAKKQQDQAKAEVRKERERREEEKREDRQRREEAAAAKKREAEEKRRKAREQKEQAAEERRLAAVKKQAARAIHAQPSLFIISLSYIADLDEIDAAMELHVAFLDKYFARGDFLVSGRQVPRKGGIIISKGNSKADVERIVKNDPFIKEGLAEFDIVEFKTSKKISYLGSWLQK